MLHIAYGIYVHVGVDLRIALTDLIDIYRKKRHTFDNFYPLNYLLQKAFPILDVTESVLV